MIADGKFKTQLDTVETVLKRVRFLEERNVSPNKGLGIGLFKGKTYRQVYEDCLREFSYDFRLKDQALLLFLKDGKTLGNGGLSFSYYECPMDVQSYEVFVGTQFGLTPFDEEFEDTIAQFGDDLKAEYEQYVASTNAKALVTPIRYDCKAIDYKEGRHPASHVHFGFGNDIRVGTRRIMNPISFVLLILRQCYPDCWERVLKDRYAANWCRNVRENIDNVDPDYWNASDQLEVSLH
jgi:hypothetical protein